MEVYLDRLGEWALCKACLQIAQDDDQAEFASGKPATCPKPEERTKYPFDLTARQYQIARLAHLTNQEIASRLMISPLTVKSHMKIIFRKMGVHSRHEIHHLLDKNQVDWEQDL